jgi:hypothetical protein
MKNYRWAIPDKFMFGAIADTLEEARSTIFDAIFNKKSSIIPRLGMSEEELKKFFEQDPIVKDVV